MDRLPQKTLHAFVLTAIGYVLLFLFLDQPALLWIHAHGAQGALRQWGELLSLLAWSPAIEVSLALGFLAALAGLLAGGGRDRPWARMLFCVCVSGAVAIVIGDGLKILLARYRPVMLFEQGLYGLHFFSTKWQLNSTPSGHTLRAFAIPTSLAMLFPRGRVPFMALAVLVGIARVAVTAHYPGDVLFGAFVGIFSALWVHRYAFRRDLREGAGTERPGQAAGPR